MNSPEKWNEMICRAPLRMTFCRNAQPFEDQAARIRRLAFANDERVAVDSPPRERQRAQSGEIGLGEPGALPPATERVVDGRFGQVLGIPARVNFA